MDVELFVPAFDPVAVTAAHAKDKTWLDPSLVLGWGSVFLPAQDFF